TAARLNPGNADDIGGVGKLDAVAGAHRRYDDAQFHGDLAAQRAHSCQQVVGRIRDDVDQVGGEQDLEGVHAHLFDEVFGGLGFRCVLFGGDRIIRCLPPCLGCLD